MEVSLEEEEQTKDSFVFSFTKKMFDNIEDVSNLINGINADKSDPRIADNRKIKDFNISTLIFVMSAANKLYNDPGKAFREEVKTRSIFNRKKFCLAANSIPHVNTENSFF